MHKHLDKYSTTSVILLSAAIAFVATPLIIGLSDLLATVFIVSGLACTILGSLTVLFSGREPVDPRLVGLLPVQACLNLCHIASDTGIIGNAHFLPPEITGETRVMQFNPELEYHGGKVSADRSFTEFAPHGLVTVPTSEPLMQDLRERNGLAVPDKAEDLAVLINEILTDIFDFAPNVSTTYDNASVTVTLQEYRFIDGCLYANKFKNPQCCSRYPCAAASLCGTLVAESTKKVVTLRQCTVSPSNQDVTIIFSF